MKTVEPTTEPKIPNQVSQASFRSAKIKPVHGEKLAIVYVRQSTTHQVLMNRESTARQYALADYAHDLGWQRDRVIIIDEDQGKSGASSEHRLGFQRLLSEVTLEHVGIILGLEMSRLARSSKDWHHLLELCAIFGTLLADQDGIYDPGDPNDRLLLGLKGTMSEMELHTMRNRLDRGRRNKASRGELFYSVPFGYAILPSGEVTFDPDEQARSVVKLLFSKFEDCGSATGAFRWMTEHDILLPIRSRQGPAKGEIEWRRCSLATIITTLHNPIYAGAYAHGRRPKCDKKPRSRKARWLPMDQWEVLIRDHLPAYITWDQYLKNRETLRANQTRPNTIGVPRNGCALLSGLVVCGQCGWRLSVTYGAPGRPHYRCARHITQATETKCAGLSAEVIDELVMSQVLRALEPAALELSIKARSEWFHERGQLEQQWKQKLTRAKYESELAERRYRAVDPDNRLVAGSLEHQWETSLRDERDLLEEHERICQHTDADLSKEKVEQITQLSKDIPAIWNSPTTSNADRQAIVRCLVDKVIVHVEHDTQKTEAVIHWKGGYESRLEFMRPVRYYHQICEFDQLINRIEELRSEGSTAKQTATVLNAEGYRSTNPQGTFSGSIVRSLRLKAGLRGEIDDDSLLRENEWWVRDLAKKVDVSWQSLREWTIKGWIHGRQTKVQKLWILWADEDERQRLKALRGSKWSGIHGYPLELITPKEKPAESR